MSECVRAFARAPTYPAPASACSVQVHGRDIHMRDISYGLAPRYQATLSTLVM